MNDQCIVCGNVIPEGRQVCQNCESEILKLGTILQSRHASKEEVYEAYKNLEKNQKKNRKTISLDNGKYTIVYDESNSYPEKILRYGAEWKNVVGDNVIFFLCEEIERLKKLAGDA